jgi:hypothetical protein
VRPDELQGEAATLFEEWRAWGCTTEEAMDLVRRSGLLGGNPYALQVYESSRAVFRSSPRAASIAALGGGDAKLPADRRLERNSHGVVEAVDFDGRGVDSSIFKPGGGR